MSGFFGLLMLLMTAGSLVSSHLHNNFLLYSISCAVCLLIHLYCRLTGETCRKYVSILFYIQISAALLFGIILSNFSQKISAAVTFNVLLVAFPFMICDVPWKVDLILTGATVLFLVTSYIKKTEEIFVIDFANSISFLLLALYINTKQQMKRLEDCYNTLIIRKQRDTDILSGTLNKRALELQLRKILSTLYTTGTLMIVDIDNFKHINDAYGHSVGDYFIADTARCLKSVCRATDIVGRFGGDEFVLFFPGLDTREAVMMKSEEIQSTVSTCFQSSSIREGITVSIGCTMIPDNGRDYDTLFVQMDKALYMAKNSGKNTYRIYDLSQM